MTNVKVALARFICQYPLVLSTESLQAISPLYWISACMLFFSMMPSMGVAVQAAGATMKAAYKQLVDVCRCSS